jgi:hypothetical protein
MSSTGGEKRMLLPGMRRSATLVRKESNSTSRPVLQKSSEEGMENYPECGAKRLNREFWINQADPDLSLYQTASISWLVIL